MILFSPRLKYWRDFSLAVADLFLLHQDNLRPKGDFFEES
jgi:hypothetical protein